MSARNRGGESRFYNPPALRRQLQQQQQQRQQQLQQNGTEKTVNSKISVERRTDPDDCRPSSSKVTVTNDVDSTNLDRFLQYTTPMVPAQKLPKTSIRRWREREPESQHQPYFVLGDLWEFFKEWSAYGAQVPLLLNGSDSVKQYYCPYLSGIQLYIDPSRTSPRLRRPGEESDTESSRETSSDDSSDFGVGKRVNNVVPVTNVQRLNRQVVSSSSDESEMCNPPGQLIFEYFEHEVPFIREPLSDKIALLASQFPELRTYRSCDLSPSSWFSVAWYPIYRIPTGPTLQNLDASFLTYHSLSTPLKTDTKEERPPMLNGDEVFQKLPLPTFGLASYKFKPSFWNLDGVHESQKASSLLQAADNWLRLLQVNHPDYKFFVNSSWK